MGLCSKAPKSLPKTDWNQNLNFYHFFDSFPYVIGYLSALASRALLLVTQCLNWVVFRRLLERRLELCAFFQDVLIPIVATGTKLNYLIFIAEYFFIIRNT